MYRRCRAESAAPSGVGSISFEAFHHQIARAVLRADVAQHADVRMIQAGDLRPT